MGKFPDPLPSGWKAIEHRGVKIAWREPSFSWGRDIIIAAEPGEVGFRTMGLYDETLDALCRAFCALQGWDDEAALRDKLASALFMQRYD